MSTPLPKLTSSEAASSLRARLAEVGYSERGLGDRLGRGALGLSRFFEPRWRDLADSTPAAIDPLIALLLMGEETKLEELTGLLAADHIRALEEMQLIKVSGPSSCLF